MNKILYFIPTSFDKFFETGQFEEKTNSVQWWKKQKAQTRFSMQNWHFLEAFKRQKC